MVRGCTAAEDGVAVAACSSLPAADSVEAEADVGSLWFFSADAGSSNQKCDQD